MIFHLIKKDLRKTWTMGLAFVGFTILLCSVVLSEYAVDDAGLGSTSGLMMSGLMLYMLVFGNTMNIEKYEEKHNGYRILAQLPVSGLDLALGKYAIVLLSTLFGVASLQIIYGAFSIIGDFPAARMKFLLVSGALGLVLNGISYMGVFKYGYQKMKPYVFGLYILCLVGPQLTVFLLAISGNEPNLVYGMAKVGALPVAAIVLVSLAVFCACAFRSGKIAERPEA